jgi:hypothetical protein
MLKNEFQENLNTGLEDSSRRGHGSASICAFVGKASRAPEQYNAILRGIIFENLP